MKFLIISLNKNNKYYDNTYHNYYYHKFIDLVNHFVPTHSWHIIYTSIIYKPRCALGTYIILDIDSLIDYITIVIFKLNRIKLTNLLNNYIDIFIHI